MTPATPEKRSHRLDWIVLALLLGLGALLRGMYLSELVGAPDYLHPVVDAHTHDYWARGLSTGNWTPPAGLPDPQITSTPFFRPPGYPYFLAAIYAASGGSPLAARLVQMFLGLCSAVLIYLLGRRWFGRGAALFAAAGMSLSWIFIYFEGELQAPALLLPLLLSFMLFLGNWTQARRWRSLLLASALLGMACLVRPNVLAFVPFLVVWLVWINRQHLTPTQRTWQVIAAGVIPTLLIVSLATIRNFRVAGDRVLISANGGVNLYIGNNPLANGYAANELPGIGRFGTCFDHVNIVHAIERKLQRPMSHSDVSDWFAAEARRYMWQNPARALLLLWKKACLLWGNTEVGNNKELYYERSHSRVLRSLPGPFAALASLALLGAILLWRARRRVDPGIVVLLGGFVLIMMLTLLPFFAAGRFRVPVLPFLLLFAGYACQDLVQRWRSRQWRGVGASVAAFAILLLIHLNLPYRYQPSLAYWQFTRGTAWMAGAQFAQAEAAFESAIQEEPGHYQARHNLASLLAKRGDTTTAIQHWQSVIAAHPEEAPGLGGLGAALLVVERPQEALPYLQRAVELQPTTAEFRANLARAYLMLGDGESALRELQRAATLAPDDPSGWRALAGMAQAQGNTRLAMEGWQQTLRLQADPYIANNIAWVMATHPQAAWRDGPQAVALATTACETTDYEVRPLLDTLAAAQAEVGQFAQAVTTSQRSLRIAKASEDITAVAKIQDRIRLYEKQQAYRDQQLP